MGQPLNLLGQRFNAWEVLYRAQSKRGQVCWHCRCVCGVERDIEGRYLRCGNSKSCGCTRGLAITKHGLSQTYFHTAFYNAKYRCTNPTYPKFEHYGGRGIQFRFESLEQFAAELGPRPTPQHSVDRTDTNGHYEPGNVRWSTKSDQVKNRRKVGSINSFSNEELLEELRRRSISQTCS
jgi:hypothetical protein